MQLTDVFCYTFLTITLTACAHAERWHNIDDRRLDKKLRRRETTLLVDNFNIDRLYEKPKLIYKRLSKHRYIQQKPTYTMRTKSKYPRKPTRRPNKKKVSAKYNNIHRKRPPFPRYGPHPTRHVPNIAYGPYKKKPAKHTKPLSFAEPPQRPGTIPFVTNVDSHQFQLASFDYATSKPGNSEPVDSYGAPIKPSLHDLTSYDTMQSLAITPTQTYASHEDFYNFGNWENHMKEEIKRPKKNYKYKKPFDEEDIEEVYVTPIPDTKDDEQSFNSYSDIYNYRQKEKSKKKSQYLNPVKFPLKPHKNKSRDDLIVGGQYAEPPVRFVPKTTPGSDFEDESPFEINDPDVVTSAFKSPYVNYKNSNMAFSPQNLNDAFSIVDK